MTPLNAPWKRLGFGAALSLVTFVPLSAQTQGTFVVRSGADTVSLERWVRYPDRLTGEIETRVLSERESFFRGALPNGSVPLLYPLSIAMLEDLVQSIQQQNASVEDARVFVWGNQRPMGAATRRLGRVDAITFDVPEMNGLRLTVNAKGELMSGTGVTGNITIARAPAQTPIVSLQRSPAAPGQAATPPMGWNSWNKFGCRIDETLIRETADALAASGMRAAGYRCNARNRAEQVRFKTMIDAVKATGRNTVFSICEWGEARPWLWGRQLGGQLWRTTLTSATPGSR